MFRQMFKSKIHRATVTDGNLHYVGSITIDQDLIEEADIIPNEKVLVVNINNGARFETYVIPGKRGSGVVCTNGGGARLTLPGDKVIIIAFGTYSEEELKYFEPRIVHVDDDNKIVHL